MFVTTPCKTKQIGEAFASPSMNYVCAGLLLRRLLGRRYVCRLGGFARRIGDRVAFHRQVLAEHHREQVGIVEGCTRRYVHAGTDTAAEDDVGVRGALHGLLHRCVRVGMAVQLACDLQVAVCAMNGDLAGRRDVRSAFFVDQHAIRAFDFGAVLFGRHRKGLARAARDGCATRGKGNERNASEHDDGLHRFHFCGSFVNVLVWVQAGP